MNDCIIDTKSKESTKSYRHVYRNNKTIKAHRASWEDVHGPIPQGMIVCHRCDNPPCINVDHLFLGTPADNTIDAMKKGRLASRKNGKHPTGTMLFCTKGHEYTPENTFWYIRKPPRLPERRCLVCRRERNKIDKRRKRENEHLAAAIKGT